MLAALAGMVLGLAFAGSPSRLANGVRIAGVDVGGKTPRQARSILERRADALASVPVTFRVGSRTWQLQPRHLGIRVDWHAAVDAVRRQGNGFGPLRGFRRLDLRFFGADVAPPTQVYDVALEDKLNEISAAVNVPHREASIVLRGLRPEVVPSRTGHLLDRHAAAATIVRALASLNREPVGLPIQIDRPKITAGDLRVAQAQVRTALSASVHLTLGATRWNLRPPRIARVLELPADGRRDVRIGGAGASSWFAALAKRVDRPPADADWAVGKSGIRVIPDRSGHVLDVPRSAKALLGAALVTAPELRSANLTVESVSADRTTADARAMDINGLVASYQTFYGGEPNRIHNVQLVSHLVDKHVIAPGETFSFNGTTGARTEDKGFLEAPVIINGELKTGLGGGVCQVSTTVFNAAYEAGLPIVSRTNHALYISHYPQGRDATVNYPDTDLKFTNDTGHWILLRTLGRLVVAHGGAVRDTGSPPGRQRDVATRRHRPAAREADQGSIALRRPNGRRGIRVVIPQDEQRAQGLRRRREAALRHDVLLVLPRGDEGHPRGHEEAAEGRDRHDDDGHDDDHPQEDDDDYDDASALAIASARACGMRVGRRVFASTQACDVHPSAISSPSRVIS